MTGIGQVVVGKSCGYTLKYEGGSLTVQIGIRKKRKMVLRTGQLNNPMSYFEVGDYNHGNEPGKVLIFDIWLSARLRKSGVIDVLKRMVLSAMQQGITDKTRFVRLPQPAVVVVACTLPI